jgi:hypothetical protein
MRRTGINAFGHALLMRQGRQASCFETSRRAAELNGIVAK